MSEKFDDKIYEPSPKEPFTLNTTGSIKQNKMPEFSNKKKQGSIIIPIEEYSSMPTKEQIQAIEQYNIGQFPEMFVSKEHSDDVETRVAGLKSTQPAKIYAAFLEAKILEDMKKPIQKKKN